MEYNFKMQRILNELYKQRIIPDCEYTIWKKQTLDGDAFYGIADFCGINTEHIIQYGKELTHLEWDGNELYFSNDSLELLKKETISAYLAIKKQMEQQYPDVVFDIVVSIDEATECGSVRFYAVRNEYHFIEPTHENLRRFEQEAVLIDTVNKVQLEKYIPVLIEKIGRYAKEIKYTDEKEIQIVNPYYNNPVSIVWDDEFTMCFDNFHAHYEEESFEEMISDIEHILSGEWVLVTVYSDGRWMRSSIDMWEKIPLEANGKLVRYLFSNNKELRKKVKEKGCVIELIGWNPEINREVVIKRE